MRLPRLSSFILILILWLVGIMSSFGQTNRFLQIHLGGGISTPMPKYRFQPMFAGLGTFYEGGFDYYFGKFGFSVQAGMSAHPTQRLFTSFIQEHYNASNQVTLTSKWETTYGLIGPVWKFAANKFELDLMGRIGLAQIKAPSMVYVKPFEQQSLELFSFYGHNNNDWNLAWSAGSRLLYKLTQYTALQFKVEYISSQSRRSTYTNTFADVQDRNKNGTLETSEYFESPRYVSSGVINLQAVNLGLGLAFQLEKSVTRKPTAMIDISEVSLPEVDTSPILEVMDVPSRELLEPMSEAKPVHSQVKSSDVHPALITNKTPSLPVVTDEKISIYHSNEDIIKERIDFIAPESSYNVQAAQFLYKAGEAYFADNDFESALPCFNKLKADPLYPHAKYMFAMTLSAMGNCDEARDVFRSFHENYKSSDKRTLEVLFQSHVDRCKNIVFPSHDRVVAENMANGTSYKVQFIATSKSDAKFPKLAVINEIGIELLQSRGIFRYNLETYYDLDQATTDMYKVRKLGFPDAFIAVYEDSVRVNTLYHAK